MCFSAAGSFALSGVLAGVGAASVSRNTSRRHLMFAAIPLLFAAQQAVEGVVWLTIDGGSPMLHRLAVFAFLGFALIVWPMWLPVSLQLIERRPERRRVLTALFWAGAIVALCSVLLLTRSQPVAVVAGHSIRYDRAGGASGVVELLILVGYALPTVVPLFVSTAHLARAIGVVLLVSIPTAALVERDAMTSVWCFFAAALSGVIWMAITQSERTRSRARAQPLGQNTAV
jgi:hypothetical protein